jgi:SlyX protein
MIAASFSRGRAVCAPSNPSKTGGQATPARLQYRIQGFSLGDEYAKALRSERKPMTNPEYRIDDLEIQIAHLTRQGEELSDIVADQAKRIDLLEKRVANLLDRARDQETAGTGAHVFGDQPPPHY